jgi:hypothetical protein
MHFGACAAFFLAAIAGPATMAATAINRAARETFIDFLPDSTAFIIRAAFTTRKARELAISDAVRPLVV